MEGHNIYLKYRDDTVSWVKVQGQCYIVNWNLETIYVIFLLNNRKQEMITSAKLMWITWAPYGRHQIWLAHIYRCFQRNRFLTCYVTCAHKVKGKGANREYFTCLGKSVSGSSMMKRYRFLRAALSNNFELVHGDPNTYPCAKQYLKNCLYH